MKAMRGRPSADDCLAARFKAGDARAFDELVEIHLDRLFAVAFGALRDREAAEEVTQEVLIRLYRQLSTSRAPSRLRPWLYRVCANLCIDWQRSRKRQPVTVELTEVADSLSAPDPTDAASERAFREAVYSVVRCMPRQQKMAFALCHFAGMSVAEIAEVLRCAPATVRVHLSRATRRLRDALSGEAGDERM